MTTWQPTATQPNLQQRAQILTKIRNFFAAKNILEVTTPLLSHSTNPAPHLHSFKCENLYLQTSPEFAMKRLLAAGSDDIYQICQAFRNHESGQQHNPEFTILEWYRIGFDHHALMDEMDEFLMTILSTKIAERFTYQEIWQQHLGIDPHQTNIAQLKACAKNQQLTVTELADDLNTWQQLLFTHLIEPKIGHSQPTFIYDFPASQAMLAKVRPGNPKLASRFEVYYQGRELANGFHELNDANEQRQRFMQDLAANTTAIPLDENFLAALDNLPNCAGVAVGIDRLMMLALQVKTIAEVITFPLERA